MWDSRRYAYDLIDDAATELAGARIREPSDVQTSRGVKHKKKALLVDCEQLYSEAVGVNQFTTESPADATRTAGESTPEEAESD